MGFSSGLDFGKVAECCASFVRADLFSAARRQDANLMLAGCRCLQTFLRLRPAATLRGLPTAEGACDYLDRSGRQPEGMRPFGPETGRLALNRVGEDPEEPYERPHSEKR